MTRRLAIGLFASAVVHVLLLLSLGSRPRPAASVATPPIEMEIVGTGDASLDDGLLRDLRFGAERLRVPPTEVLGDRDQLSTLWDFRYEPGSGGPALGFSFDIVNLIDKRAIPKPSHKHVELVDFQ